MNTPLMRQYAQMKAKYPDTVLLFRLGDFYETFQEDAKTTSRVLGITLTRRNNGAAGETPLAGFPHHALEAYLPKLLKAGYRVAVCEQLEDPKLAKGLVKRDVVEVMTPGVAFSDKVLNQKQNNYLAAVALPHALAAGDDTAGLAFIDVTTAEFYAGECTLRELVAQIASITPAEILVQSRDRQAITELLRRYSGGLITKLDDWVFNREYAYELLINHFQTQTLKGYGIDGMGPGMVAAGAVMNYLQETQKTNLQHIRKVVPFQIGDQMMLDSSTKRNLEIGRTLDGSEEGTLVWVLDRTTTPMGGRLLRKWINQPLRKLEPIRMRLEAVDELVMSADHRKALLPVLSRIGDLERLIARICTNRANPREVASLRSMLTAIGDLSPITTRFTTACLKTLHDELRPLPGLVDLIGTALTDEPPLALNDGGVIRPGFNTELDQLRALSVDGKSWIANLQKTERERTGISSLKVGFNNVFGYYLEVTNSHKEKVPGNWIRKQTLANAERYVTPELKEYEDKVLNAQEKILALETELFNTLRSGIAAQAEAIQQNARLVGMLDCFCSLARVADKNGYVRPVVSDDTLIRIVQGRHPVIEQLLPPGESYTPNDTTIDTSSDQVLIITGPNMSGKSSYLRQVGLITLLAQIGSFVPAKEASIGIVDRIYTRVGASDNIASGESTFLVEMHEAANIVNTATKQSLILLDEVGRGTSTFDGISIAWALTEYIHNRLGARTLFATHYHELNELADLFPRIRNLKVEVREYGDKVIFLHTVVPGFADHSYGIQVAQMAGLPDEVTDRAKIILNSLEGSGLSVGSGDRHKGRIAPADIQMTLFELNDDPIRERLQHLDVERITPLEAMQRLAELKTMADGKSRTSTTRKPEGQ